MTPDPKIDCAGAPVLSLGGQEFFVPILALRQARVAVPGLLRLLPRIAAIQARVASGDPLGAAMLEAGDVDLMVDVVHAGLTRAYPDFSREHLLEIEADFAELIAALGVVARQTGLFASSESAQPGE